MKPPRRVAQRSAGDHTPSASGSVSRARTSTSPIVARHALPIVALLVAIVAGILYAPTVAPTIGFIDSGELIAAASTLGIAHPTGYPTMMMFGWLVTRVVPGDPARVLNLLSMILTALGAGVACLLLGTLLEAGDGSPPGSRRPSPDSRRLTHAMLSGCAALSLAVTRPWWSQATGFEVYSLHLILMPAALLLVMRAIAVPAGRLGSAIAAFALGFSFSNHLTTVLVLPALAVWALLQSAIHRRTPITLLRLAPWFLLGLVPYVYLVVRAQQDPVMNWGNPSSLGRLLAHVTGRQYSGWMFRTAFFTQQTRYFLSGVPRDWGYLGLVVAAIGVVAARRRPAVLAFGALLIAASVLYAGNFEIHEILPYYLTATLGIGVFYAAGLQSLRERLGTWFAMFAAVGTLGLGVWSNVRGCDESRNWLSHDLARDVLAVADSNAVVFSVEWSTWISAAMYVQNVEGLRRDVCVIQTNTLQAPWRLEELERRHPELTEPARQQIDRYLGYTRRIDRGQHVPPDSVMNALQAMLDSLVATAMPHRPVYVTQDLAGSLSQGVAYVPTGLLYRVLRAPAEQPLSMPPSPMHRVDGVTDFYSISVLGMRARAAENRARYEWGRGKPGEAAELLRYAQALDPHLLPEQLPHEPLDGESIARTEIAYFAQLQAIRVPAASDRSTSPLPR